MFPRMSIEPPSNLLMTYASIPISQNLHHMSMGENKTSATEAVLNPGKWIGQLVAAVILAEGIWRFLASLTNNLLMPLLARVMEVDPQSPLYLGKGELNIPALFKSVLTLCLAGIVFALLHEWSGKKRPQVRVKMVRVTKKVSRPAGPPSIMAVSEPITTQTLDQSAAPQISQEPFSAPSSATPSSKPTPPTPIAAAKPAKPKPAKEVYYNTVGEPINPTERD